MTATPVSLVTGASRRIGRGSRLVARQRHVVLVNYRSRQDAADEVVATIHRAGGHAISVQGDGVVPRIGAT